MSSFMQPQVEFGRWWEYETYEGTNWLPADLFTRKQITDNFTIGELDYIIEVEGWGARLSAPGYLDCTDWVVFPTEKQAREYLVEMYDIEV